jgi:hypothetical protein
MIIEPRNHCPRRFGTRTDFAEAWDTVKSWLGACSSDLKCRPSNNFDLPTRLIDIGGSNDWARLVESQNVRPSSQYCTLSHCWGSIPILKLENHNYHEFLKRFPWDRLTRTFQHAIIAARKLGYDCIWIDSLCIIQNDLADWSVQSTKMAAIYKSSALNLAASAGADGNVGLFFDRDERSFWEPTLITPATIHARRPKHYRAPSWSWASLDAPLALSLWFGLYWRSKPYTRLIESNVVPVVEGDIFGQVKSGYLRTQGCRLISPRLTWDRENTNNQIGAVYMIGSETQHEIVLFFDEPPYMARESVILMLLELLSFSTVSIQTSLKGLMLKAEALKGYYTRVGVFQVQGPPRIRSVEGFLELPGLDDEGHYHSIETDENGKKSYVVTLV